MPLTPAERQRRYRERLKLNDPQKWQEVQEKHLIRTKNKYIPIRQLSESEKKVRRKEWRRSKQQITGEKSDEIKCCRKVYKKRYNKITRENEKLREIVNTLIRKNKALKETIQRYKILQVAHSQDNDQDKENISNEITKTDYNATDFQKPTYFDNETNKSSSCKVTILSNVKVNYKLSDLKKITKPAQSYNVFELKKDFSEMFDDSDDEAIF